MHGTGSGSGRHVHGTGSGAGGGAEIGNGADCGALTGKEAGTGIRSGTESGTHGHRGGGYYSGVGGVAMQQDNAYSQKMSRTSPDSKNMPMLDNSAVISSSMSTTQGSKESTKFHPGRKFRTIGELLHHVKEYSAILQFVTYNHPKVSFSSEDAYELFQVPSEIKVPRRGRISCSKKYTNRDKTSGCCPFGISYKWVPHNSCYKIVSVDLSHNHDLGSTSIHFGECDVINIQSELTVHELNAIEFLATSRQSMPNMKTHLESQFPGRCFTSALIKQIVI